MHNRTNSDWFVETKEYIVNMPTSRMLLFGASFVFLILITRGRRTWLNFFHFTMFVEGIQYLFFPRSMSLWFTGELDEVHIWLIRSMGLACLHWSMTYFLLSRSTDSTTETSVLLGLLVMVFTSLLEKGHMYNHPAKKGQGVRIENEEMCSMFYITLLSVGGSLFHVLRSSDWGGYSEQSSHANFHMRVQFVLLLVPGILNYAMPQWSIKTAFAVETVDTVHIFLARAIGCALFAMAVLTLRTANFLRPSDKEAVFASQWIFFLISPLVALNMIYSRWSHFSWAHAAFEVIFDLVILLNVTGALNRDLTVFKRVVLPRFTAVPYELKMYLKRKRL